MNTQNLTILADWLEANREWIERENRFDMEHYECGTVHCAAGWASKIPELIKKYGVISHFGSFDYEEFSNDAFGLLRYEFYFLFSSYWKHYDNTIAGAIARIRYLINGNEIRNHFYNPELYKAYLPK